MVGATLLSSAEDELIAELAEELAERDSDDVRDVDMEDEGGAENVSFILGR